MSGFCNSVTNCATLTVAVPPAITAQPQNQASPVGNTATFSVTVSSAVPVTYQWQIDGTDMPDATSASYTTPPLFLADSGAEYRVIISNCMGSVTSAAATLTPSALKSR